MHRARMGDGPTLIEAVTYRMGPHTTADDPARYRTEEERQDWLRRDPIERLRIYLSERGRWDGARQARIEAQATSEIERAIALAESLELIGFEVEMMAETGREMALKDLLSELGGAR